MANESPKCPKCGFVMVEDFEYRRVNEHADIAIPTGQFSCFKCKVKVTQKHESAAH